MYCMNMCSIKICVQYMAYRVSFTHFSFVAHFHFFLFFHFIVIEALVLSKTLMRSQCCVGGVQFGCLSRGLSWCRLVVLSFIRNQIFDTNEEMIRDIGDGISDLGLCNFWLKGLPRVICKGIANPLWMINPNLIKVFL